MHDRTTEDLERLLPEEQTDEKGAMSSGFTSQRRRSIQWIWVLLGASTLLNCVLLIQYGRHTVELQTCLTPHQCSSLYKSPYSGLSFDTTVEYTTTGDYVSDNETLADQLWDRVENLLAIQVSKSYAEQTGLPPSWAFPWDLDKTVYFPKIGHQLHCLKSMRRAFHQLRKTGNTSVADEHVDHCLNSLRQDLMCYADETPMATRVPLNGLGNGQSMQCKNWDKFIGWLYADERHACYKHINSWTGSRHLIERYAFCPKNSVYFPIMQSYFDVHGHKETIEDWG